MSSRSSFEDIDYNSTAINEPKRRNHTNRIATSAKAPTVASMQRELSSESHFHPAYGHAREVSFGKVAHIHGGAHAEVVPVPEESGIDLASVVSQVTIESFGRDPSFKAGNKTTLLQHLQRSSSQKGKPKPLSEGMDNTYIEYTRNKFRWLFSFLVSFLFYHLMNIDIHTGLERIRSKSSRISLTMERNTAKYSICTLTRILRTTI